MPTTLSVTNRSNQDVLTFITLGSTPGCVHNVSDLRFSDDSIHLITIAPLNGKFTLPVGKSCRIDAPSGKGFNGNFSFGTPPLNGPSPGLPHGVNLAEFIINNGFQPGGQETIDISVVTGANAIVSMSVSAEDWTSNGGKVKVKSFQNKEWDQSTGIVGVFPYGCDNCTSSDNPPREVGRHPEFCNKEPICNVQRSATKNQGGNLDITFIKFIDNQPRKCEDRTIYKLMPPMLIKSKIYVAAAIINLLCVLSRQIAECH